MEKEIIKKCLDFIILIAELDEVKLRKHYAVKDQNFELASQLRDEEKKLLAEVPTLEEIRNLRNNLN